MPTDLRIAVSTADFLPATAWSRRAVARVREWSRAEGLVPPELLTTRSVTAPRTLPGQWTSVHEVWNPRRSLWSEISNIARRGPQARGMTPSPVDSLFFADGLAAERAMIRVAERLDVPAVVSTLDSPVTGLAYGSRAVALQVHPDLGPDGSHLPAHLVAAEIDRRDLPVVLDTYHVRRRVRLHPRGRTEVAPPPAGADDRSLGGIRAIWDRLGPRITLVHLQFALIGELIDQLEGRWSEGIGELRPLLPEIAARRIPVVIEVNPGWMRSPVWRAAAGGMRMTDLLLRIRDRLAESA